MTRVTVTGVGTRAAPAEGSAWLRETIGEPRAQAPRSFARRPGSSTARSARCAPRPQIRWSQEIGATQALAIRFGHGSGDELAEGRWTEASELAPPRRGRLDDVEPQSRVAAVLAGRDEVHPAETLMLRARLDAHHGRDAEARHGLRAAREALEEDPGPRRDELLKELAAIEEKLGYAASQ